MRLHYQDIQRYIDVRHWYKKQTLSKKAIIISVPIIIFECILLIQVQRFAREIECAKNSTALQKANGAGKPSESSTCFDYMKVAITAALFTIFDLIFVIGAKIMLKMGGFYNCDALKQSDGLHFSFPLLAPWLAKMYFSHNVWIALLCLSVTAILMSLWYKDFYFILRSAYNALFKFKVLTLFDWNYFNFHDLLLACMYFVGIVFYASHLLYYTYSIPFGTISHSESFTIVQFLLHCLFICPFPKLPFSAMLMAIYHVCHLLHADERQIYAFPEYSNFVAVEVSYHLEYFTFS